MGEDKLSLIEITHLRKWYSARYPESYDDTVKTLENIIIILKKFIAYHRNEQAVLKNVVRQCVRNVLKPLLPNILKPGMKKILYDLLLIAPLETLLILSHQAYLQFLKPKASEL